MEKPAETAFPIHELLKARWSPRVFSNREIELGVLCQLFEAARWSASSFNEQPWRFLVEVKGASEDYGRLLACLTEKNREWAGRAPVLMLSIAKMQFEKTGKDNRHAFYDVGQAVQNLSVQATASGLSLHQMAGFDREQARGAFHVPPGFEPVAVIALGYPGGLEGLSEEAVSRELAPRARHPISSFAFTGQFGDSAPWCVHEFSAGS